MTIAGLAPSYRGQVMLPVLGRVRGAGCTDRVSVRLVSGQSPADFAGRAEGLAHGFRAHMCRVRAAVPGGSCWNWSAGMRWPSRCRRCPSRGDRPAGAAGGPV